MTARLGLWIVAILCLLMSGCAELGRGFLAASAYIGADGDLGCLKASPVFEAVTQFRGDYGSELLGIPITVNEANAQCRGVCIAELAAGADNPRLLRTVIAKGADFGRCSAPSDGIKISWLAPPQCGSRPTTKTIEVLELLRINKATFSPYTLHFAISYCPVEVTKYLVTLGLDPSAPPVPGGRTPLHIAVSLRDQIKISYLVEAGANVNARTVDGHTPFDFAGGDATMEKLLTERRPNSTLQPTR